MERILPDYFLIRSILPIPVLSDGENFVTLTNRLEMAQVIAKPLRQPPQSTSWPFPGCA